MVNHVILWKLKEEYNNEDIKDNIKNGLEGLQGKIPGLLKIKVQTNNLKSSNADVMLYSIFENDEALKEYSVNPLHVEVANSKVRPFTEIRLCMDFYEN